MSDRHLTVEQMVEYVCVQNEDEESLRFLAEMNEHLDGCPACAEKVDAFQELFDAAQSGIGCTAEDLAELRLMVEQLSAAEQEAELWI